MKEYYVSSTKSSELEPNFRAKTQTVLMEGGIFPQMITKSGVKIMMKVEKDTTVQIVSRY